MIDTNSSNLNSYAVIMAGGQGSRLWPLSRSNFPKQFLSLGIEDRSLLQAAVERAKKIVGSMDRIIVVARKDQEDLVREQLPDIPELNLLLEPVSRNTAACIGYAAFNLLKRDSNAVMAVFPADHLYKNEEPWIETIKTALIFAQSSEYLVTIGLIPEFPSPNYGYIQKGEPIQISEKNSVFKVVKFVEKPEISVAEKYVKSGKYLWNTGTFCWRADSFLETLKSYLPAHYQGFQRVMDVQKHEDKFLSMYQSLENISVDYGVMERAEKVAVVMGKFERIDLGNLLNLKAIYPSDKHGNMLHGQSICFKGKDNIIFSQESNDQLTVLYGLSNMVVIHMEDVVFVCPQSSVNEIKALIGNLKAEGLSKFL